MKTFLYLFLGFTLCAGVYAQTSPKPQPAKAKSSKAEELNAKKLRKAQLKKSPQPLNLPDPAKKP